MHVYTHTCTCICMYTLQYLYVYSTYSMHISYSTRYTHIYSYSSKHTFIYTFACICSCIHVHYLIFMQQLDMKHMMTVPFVMSWGAEPRAISMWFYVSKYPLQAFLHLMSVYTGESYIQVWACACTGDIIVRSERLVLVNTHLYIRILCRSKLAFVGAYIYTSI